MNKWVIAICLVAILFLQNSSSKITFEGGWTDSISYGGIGGIFYICVNNVTVNGLYSENGVVVGTLIGSTLAGNFYEGTGGGGCNTGSFQITLSQDGNSFSGFYICDDEPGSQLTWNETRVTTQTPSPKQCALLSNSTSPSATALWVITNSTTLNRLDFCQGSSTYQVSFKSNTSLTSYGKGTIYDNYLINAGIYYTINFDGSLPGSSLFYIGSLGDLYHIYWAGLGQRYYNLSSNPNFHSYTKYVYIGPTTDNDCRANSYLSAQPYDYYPLQEELQFYNYDYYHPASASQITISAFLGLLMLVAMF